MEDIILRDYILSAASVIYAVGGSNADNPTELSVSDLSQTAATLDTNNALIWAHLKSWVIDLELQAA